jgi:hypothetical protein
MIFSLVFVFSVEAPDRRTNRALAEHYARMTAQTSQLLAIITHPLRAHIPPPSTGDQITLLIVH